MWREGEGLSVGFRRDEKGLSLAQIVRFPNSISQTNNVYRGLLIFVLHAKGLMALMPWIPEKSLIFSVKIVGMASRIIKAKAHRFPPD